MYLEAAGHAADREGPLFRPVRQNWSVESLFQELLELDDTTLVSLHVDCPSIEILSRDPTYVPHVRKMLVAGGAPVQLAVTAELSDGTIRQVASADTGTDYGVTNTDVATVSLDGLVTPLRPGVVAVCVTHLGGLGFIQIPVAPKEHDDADHR